MQRLQRTFTSTSSNSFCLFFLQLLLLLLVTGTDVSVSSFSTISTSKNNRSGRSSSYLQNYYQGPMLRERKMRSQRQIKVDRANSLWMISKTTKEPEKETSMHSSMVRISRIFVASFLIYCASILSIAPNTISISVVGNDHHHIHYCYYSSSTAEAATLLDEGPASSERMAAVDNFDFFTTKKELKIQPKYLDLASELKEELKSKSNQFKEIADGKIQSQQDKMQVEAQKRADKLKEYDEKFDQAAKDRDLYYSQKVISKDSYYSTDKQQYNTVTTTGTPMTDENEKNQQPAMTMLEQLNEIKSKSKKEQLQSELQSSEDETQRLRTALTDVDGKMMNSKDAEDDNKNLKVERTLLKLALEKSEGETNKLRKELNLERSLDTIRSQRREEEIRVYEERSERNEKSKQEAINRIKLAKQKQQDELEETRRKKRQQLQELKFKNEQILYERKLDDIDKFAKRKGLINDE